MMTGEVRSDPTLQHPRCVLNILKRHFSRYTPEMVERICGISPEQFHEVAETLIANSGRDRTTALCYARRVDAAQRRRADHPRRLDPPTPARQHRPPGGGIMALRGHATIQGSTDIPTLYDLLPGYLPMPHARQVGTYARGVRLDERCAARLVGELHRSTPSRC